VIYDGRRGPVVASLLLQGGFDAICLDRRSKAEARSDKPPDKAVQVTKVSQALRSAATVITVLDSQQSDEDIYMAGGGIFEVAQAKSLFIDLSSITPRMARELGALAAVHDHHYVDCALLGSLGELSEGRARILAAGEPTSLKRARDVLGALASDIVETGLAGTGVAAKLAWQVAVASSLAGLVEALAFAGLNNVDKGVMLSLLASPPSPSHGVAQAFGQAIIDEDFSAGHEVKGFLADLSIALEAADEGSLPLPALETVQQMYDLLQLIGDDRRGIQSLALAYYDERSSERSGLDWSLAQRAMDVYERGGDAFEEYFDHQEDDDFGPHDHGQQGRPHDHRNDSRHRDPLGFDPYGPPSGPGGEGPISSGSFFSDN
jgi:3-hydroxyisobutyrate dehydrogenase